MMEANSKKYWEKEISTIFKKKIFKSLGFGTRLMITMHYRQQTKEVKVKYKLRNNR